MNIYIVFTRLRALPLGAKTRYIKVIRYLYPQIKNPLTAFYGLVKPAFVSISLRILTSANFFF